MDRVVQGLRRVLYWLLPIAIFVFILLKIDVGVLIESISRADPRLYLAGVLFFPSTLLIGAIRWNVLIRLHLGISEKIGYLFRQYAIGLSVSIFLPGQIGMDIYRVAVTGRRFGRYVQNIAIVLEEKLLSLVICMALILGVTPWLEVDTEAPALARIVNAAVVILLACGGAFLLLMLTSHSAAAKRVLSWMSARVQRAIVSVLAKLKVERVRSDNLPPLADLFRPVANPLNLLPVLLLSIATFIALAIANQFFLAAVGHDLPFIASIFVVSVIFFAVSMPVSFAGFGVREAAFILVLGLFGVPAEAALVVSFFALSGLLLNYAIGGLSIYLSKNDAVQLSRESLLTGFARNEIRVSGDGHANSSPEAGVDTE